MPVELLILLGVFVLIAVLFLYVKRPIYEIMAIAFVFVVITSGQWADFGYYLTYPATNNLFYIIFAFLVVAVIFDATDAVNRIIRIMLALIGRLPGGAGYVALMASAFMSSLSGTGPGNVAATGVFTIPMMKRTGFSPHFAATTEMSASMLGNIIPPSGIVILAFGIYHDVTGDDVSLSTWLLAAYIIGAWFFLQRLITLFVLAKINNVKPVPADEMPKLGPALKEGWSAMLLPLVIFIPLFVDSVATDFLVGRIGEDGAAAFSDAVLMFTPALAAAYAVMIGRKNFSPGVAGAREFYGVIINSLKAVVPISATIYFAYATSEAFGGMGVDDAIRDVFVAMNVPLWLLIIIIPIFFGILGMILPGSAQIAILGGAMISVFAELGGDPIILAALLPAMTGALEGMTPPLALGLYVAIGIAESDFNKTVRYAFIWIILHVVLSMFMLAGLVPIFVL